MQTYFEQYAMHKYGLTSLKISQQPSIKGYVITASRNGATVDATVSDAQVDGLLGPDQSVQYLIDKMAHELDRISPRKGKTISFTKYAPQSPSDVLDLRHRAIEGMGDIRTLYEQRMMDTPDRPRVLVLTLQQLKAAEQSPEWLGRVMLNEGDHIPEIHGMKVEVRRD
jgi:hypothetical protein